MLLCVDAGNTNIVFALADKDGQFKHVWRIPTDDKPTADLYAAWLSPLFQFADINFADVSGMAVSSVVPALDFTLTRLGEKYFNCQPKFIGRDIAVPLKLNLNAGAKLGTDMASSCVAALEQYKLPLVIVDFGTATTFQVLDKNGVHQGGMIAPGINLSLKALYMGAAKLPQIGFAKTDTVLAKDTPSCMQAGVFWGYVSMVEGLLKRIETEMGVTPTVIATGGLAPLIAESLPTIQHVSTELTMRGIYLMYQKAAA